MIQAFVNIFTSPDLRDLRRKLLFTIFILIIYRIGFWVPLPGVDQTEMEKMAQKQAEQQTVNSDNINDVVQDAARKMGQFLSIFSGGSLTRSTVFGLGIMPYISAAIIFQLLGTVSERLKELQKDPAGRQKFQEWIRYTTVPICLVQAFVWMKFLQAQNLIYPEYQTGLEGYLFWFAGITGLTAGTIFLMWLGEQIDKYGIGNGASLIITAGILAQMPSAILWVVNEKLLATGGAGADPTANFGVALFLIFAFVVVVVGSVLITQGQRRIPIQHAKHTRGRRVYAGQRSFLPLRVNHGGVMPIIFASSLMVIPTMIIPMIQAMADRFKWQWLESGSQFFNEQLTDGQYLHAVVYIVMVYFFSYFWTSVQFQPTEISNQLRDSGSLIPGRRPGPRTATYLEEVMERITYCGAGFLAVIAVIPSLITGQLGVPFTVSAFLGGTGLLITVAVGLDFVQRIESEMMMRNHPGFLTNADGKAGPKIRGARS